LTDTRSARTVHHQMTTYLSRRNPPAWIFASYGLATLSALLIIGLFTANGSASAQTSAIEPRSANDPAAGTYGMTDPVRSSLHATEQLRNRLMEQQHRFQPKSNRRQLRPRRPEPGEVEVTRGGDDLRERDRTLPSDPLRNTLRSILPRDR
jgi:hypothetical protein